MGCDIFPNWLHLCPLEANLVYAALDPLQQITDPPPPLQFPVHQYRTLGNNVTDLIVQRLRDWRFLMIFHFIGCVTSEPHIGFCVFTLFSLCNNERNEWWKYSDSSVTEQYWTPRVLVRLYFLSNPSLHSCTHLCCCLHPPRTPPPLTGDPLCAFLPGAFCQWAPLMPALPVWPSCSGKFRRSLI